MDVCRGNCRLRDFETHRDLFDLLHGHPYEFRPRSENLAEYPSRAIESDPNFSSQGGQQQITTIFEVKIQNLRFEPAFKRKLLLTQASSMKILSPIAGRCELGQKTILSISEGGTTAAQFVGTDQPESTQNIDCVTLLKNMKSQGFTVEFTDVPVDYLGGDQLVSRVILTVAP